MKNLTKIALIGCVLAALLCSCTNEPGGGGSDYDMTGIYTFTKTGGPDGSGECTWVFTAYGNYECSGYAMSRTITGTWKSNGNDVTISYSAGDITGKEVFTVQANGDQVTLTIKDNSAVVSVSLAQFGMAVKSVTLTKTASSDMWTAVSDAKFGIYGSINGIAWGGPAGNEKFVAVGNGGKMAYSSDGVTWKAVSDSTFGSYDDIRVIAWGNNKFVAGGSSWSDSGGKMAYSSDGVTWKATDSTFDGYIYAIAWGNDKFVAGGELSYMAYSSDGVTWEATDSTFDGYIYAIAWGGPAGNQKFVAVGSGSNTAYSTDGVSWHAVMNNSTFSPNGRARGIAWGIDKFVIAGYISRPYTYGYYSYGKMAYSSDGVTWEAVSDSTFGEEGEEEENIIYTIAWGGTAGNQKFVAGGKYGKMAYSSDGVTWTEVSNIYLGYINGIAWGNDKFVAVGGGKMAYWDGNTD